MEYIQHIGIHISLIYQNIQLQELRIEALSQKLLRIQHLDRLSRKEFIALARGILCPTLHEKWKITPKFLETETWLSQSCPSDDLIKEITPQINPDAKNLLDKATALDCNWAKHIILKSDTTPRDARQMTPASYDGGFAKTRNIKR